MSVGIISASEVSVNDTYTAPDSSADLLDVDEGGVESNSSNILSIDNIDIANLDEDIIWENYINNVHIKASDLTIYYKNETNLTAQLVNRLNDGLTGQPLTFDISLENIRFKLN